MRHFLLIAAVFAAISLSAQQPVENRRHYRPSRSFLENRDENCFEATRREADRAFAQRCWDDASLLYRAAKNCIDADQKRRQEVSDRLEDCRAAAEQELINRERHAIAANRADDSRDLLRRADRSLAYRMADFANTYIAPPGEDNPDCQQAMFDAWYPSPGVTGVGDRYDPVQIPFCYQLGENLGERLTIKFGSNGSKKKIYAFSGSRHLLYSWDAQTLEPDEPSQIDPSMMGFEIAPDGNTFLFYSDKTLIFWRKGRELYRLSIPHIHDYCFDTNGEDFYLLDSIEHKIDILSLKEVSQGSNLYNNKIQKQRKMEEVRTPPSFRPWISGIAPGVLDFAVNNGDVWLGYRDSLLILRKLTNGKGWQRINHFELGVSMPNGVIVGTPFLRLLPEMELAFYGNDTASVCVSLPSDDSKVVVKTAFSGYPLAVPSLNGLTATLKSESYLHAGKIQIFNIFGDLVYFSAVQELEFYPFMAGALDPDGDWLIIPSSTGVLHCWRLGNSQQSIFHTFSMGVDYGPDISPDGHAYISQNQEKVQVFDCLEPNKALCKPLPYSGLTLGASDHKMSNHWVASPYKNDSILIWNWQTDKKWLFDIQNSIGAPLVAFTPNEDYVAVANTDGQIRVYNLSDGQLASTHAYAGHIREMVFVPGTNELVVLQVSTSDYDYAEKTVLRIIHPFNQKYRQRTVRLHEYNISLMTVSSQGDYLAVSDGQDIRIFELDNLTDEMAQILPTGEGTGPGSSAFVLAMEFSPDGRSLVASYSDQTVVFWNIFTGLANFRLQSPAESSYMSFNRIRIIPEGNLLCLLSPNDGLLIRSLDPTAIRTAIQPAYHQLIAFSPDQIRKYNLDQALNYPGNFERLANSGDIPLINSFFNYYFQQAGASSNIDRVSEYCDRAFVLYSQLDVDTRSELRSTMLVMYDNYLWKWLIRDRPDKADQVLQHLNRQFGRPLIGVLAEAHIALLRGDLRKASRQYAEWTIRMSETPFDDGSLFDPSMRLVFDKFVQLAEFELINDQQIDCLCGMFGEWRNFSLCTNRSKNTALVPFDNEMRLRWDIYKKTYLAAQAARFTEQINLLQSAAEDARQLSRIKTTLGRTQVEKVAHQTARSYLNWARFEQGNNYTPQLCRKGIALLEETGPFHQQKDEQLRLEDLAYLYHELATDQYNKDQLDSALTNCKKGYEISEQLWNITTDTMDLRRYSDDLVGNQLALIGNIEILLGDFETARTAYEEANNYLTLGLNSYFTAHVDLLEGNEIAALLNYGGILTTEQLGSAIFDLERLAGQFPNQKDSILQFIPRLRTAWVSNHPRANTAEIDYRFARLQTQRAAFLKRYDEALHWNSEAQRYIELIKQGKNSTYDLGEFWADAVLNQSYYLVYNGVKDTANFTKAIEVAKEAEAKALEDGQGGVQYASAEYFKTNMAHAYLLRNQPGDEEKAIAAYQDFLALDFAGSGSYWDVLQKDFRDLHDAGLKWPNLKKVIEAIKPPYITLSPEEWQEMGNLN